MPRSLRYRLLLIVGLAIWGGLYLVPSFRSELPGWWPPFLPSHQIRLGLDLRGGTYLLLSVDLDKAVENSVDRYAQELRQALAEEGVGTVRIRREGRALRITVDTDADRDATREVLDARFPILEPRTAGGSSPDIVVDLDRRQIDALHEYAVDQSLETIRNRVDQFGVAEPTIQRQGDRNILVQLPGIQDPERAKELIGKTALLEFKLVVEEDDGAVETETLTGQDRDPLSGEITRTEYTLEREALLTGDGVADARVRPSVDIEGPYVELILSDRGADIFEEVTGANVGRRLAIILDNTVYSAPVIRDRIGGGRASITGGFDISEARDLAIVLRAGALPAPVTIAEERTVGPSLGRDSIEQGTWSFIVGGAVVLLFMVIYYNLAGVLADVALGLNILLLLAALAMFDATLTLPGIAGIVLTVGMAVDANVLINERMREEVRLGKGARAAVESGYERALPAIFDSNITTFLSGLILFQFGSGPIKGFAVTLCIGIVSTVFTTVFCTRAVYDYCLIRRRLTRLSL